MNNDADSQQHVSDGSLSHSSGGQFDKSRAPRGPRPASRPRSDSHPNGRYAPLSITTSDAPRLDLLSDITADGLQRSSTFRAGLEKAVDDINTKYGDKSKPYVASTSPTPSVAIRSKNGFRPRYQLPTFVEAHATRIQPNAGEMATLENTAPLAEKISKTEEPQVPSCEVKDKVSPFDDVNKTCSDAGSVVEADQDTSQVASHTLDGAVTGNNTPESSSLPDSVQDTSNDALEQSQEVVSKKSVPSTDAESADGHGGVSLSDETGSETRSYENDSDEEDENAKNDGNIESGTLGNGKAKLTSAGTEMQDEMPAVAHERSVRQPRQPPPGGFPEPAGKKRSAPTREENKQHDPSSRAASGVSVAEMVNRFRSMEDRPKRRQQASTDDQDESAAESTTRLIQSYRRSSSEESNDGSGFTTPHDYERDPILGSRPSTAGRMQKTNWHSET